MRAHAEAGDTVVVISATFEPIILRAMEHHPFDNQISTRMSVATDGTYTRAVEGLPVEGEEKLAAVRRFGDSRFGPGNWELAYAYGDHHSDPRRAVGRGASSRRVARSAARPHRARKGLGDPRLVEPCAHTFGLLTFWGFCGSTYAGAFFLGKM